MHKIKSNRIITYALLYIFFTTCQPSSSSAIPIINSTVVLTTQSQESNKTLPTDIQLSNLSNDLDERIQKKVDRAFSTNTTLLNVFIGALATLTTLLGVVSVIAGLYFFILRKSVEEGVKQSVVDQVLKQVNLIEFQERLDNLESDIKRQANEIKNSVTQFQLNLDTLNGEFNKLQMMREINEYVVDLPPEAVPFLTEKKVQRLLIDVESLLNNRSLIFTARDHINIGNTFLFSKKYDKALEMYEMAVEKNPSESDFWVQKGKAFYYLQKYDLALESCKIAIKLNPDNFRAWNVRGTVFGQLSQKANQREEYQKNLDEEYRCYQKAIEIDSRFPLAWYNLACHFSLKGELEEGFKMLEKAVSLNRQVIIPQAEKDIDLNNLRKNDLTRFNKIIFYNDSQNE